VSDPKNVKHLDIAYPEAFAKSCNVTFGKIGLLVGKTVISEYGAKYRFNKNIDFDFPVQNSTMDGGEGSLDLAKFACGEGDVTLSPIHAALLSQTVANNGIMMRPYIVDKILKKNGKVEYQSKPEELGKVIEPATAEILKRFMMGTIGIKRASAHKTFFDRRERFLFPGAEIAGKTGSLSSKDPAGWCTWFVGFMNYNGREIAVSTVVVNKNIWRMKSQPPHGLYPQELLRELFLIRCSRKHQAQSSKFQTNTPSEYIHPSIRGE